MHVCTLHSHVAFVCELYFDIPHSTILHASIFFLHLKLKVTGMRCITPYISRFIFCGRNGAESARDHLQLLFHKHDMVAGCGKTDVRAEYSSSIPSSLAKLFSILQRLGPLGHTTFHCMRKQARANHVYPPPPVTPPYSCSTSMFG